MRLTDEEVIKILQKNQKDVTDLEREEDEEEMSGEESSNQEIETEESETQSKDRDIEKIYNMDSYDDEDDSNAAGFENLAAFVGEDPYLKNGDIDEESDKEDFIIKPTDNLLLLGHVDGNASILEVYGKLIFDQSRTMTINSVYFQSTMMRKILCMCITTSFCPHFPWL